MLVVKQSVQAVRRWWSVGVKFLLSWRSRFSENCVTPEEAMCRGRVFLGRGSSGLKCRSVEEEGPLICL